LQKKAVHRGMPGKKCTPPPVTLHIGIFMFG
jgi:hypothetical protein